jgi:hypothetical protein
VRAPLGVYALAVLALALAVLPYAAGYLAAPRGKIFLGALNNLGDTGQYLAALRQGTQGHLLYVNQYTSLRVAPVLIYPLYTATGLLLAPLRLAAPALYQLLHLLAAVALLAALWHFCRTVVLGKPVLAYAVTLFGGGLYLPALLLSSLVRLPFEPMALTAPELSLFATLLISPHGAVGLAAELWALAGYVRWRRDGQGRHLVVLSVGGLVLGLSYPFGLPVLLTVVVVDAVTSHARPAAHAPQARRMASETLLALSLLPALTVALYYAVLFHHDPLWGASNMLRLPPPSISVLAAAFGPLLALGLLPMVARAGPQLWPGRGRRRQSILSSNATAASGTAVPVVCHTTAVAGDVGAQDGLGGRRAPYDPARRLVATWAIVNGLLLLAPLPQSERLLSGWSVPLAILAAAVLGRMRRQTARRLAVALALSNVVLALLYLMVVVAGRNPDYYERADEAAAVAWLAAHAGPDDVVMASAGSGNLIVSAARCRVVVGQNFETFNWGQAQRDVLRYYARSTPAAERTAILHRNQVTLVLDGPYEHALGPFTPPAGHGYRLVHTSGPVRVFAVEAG